MDENKCFICGKEMVKADVYLTVIIQNKSEPEDEYLYLENVNYCEECMEWFQ